MKRYLMFSLAFLFLLSLNFLPFERDGDDLPSVSSYYDGPNFTHNFPDTGVSCATLPPSQNVIKADGSFENGYRSTSDGDSTTMVHKMILGANRTITSVCWTWTALSPSGSLTHNIVVYDTTGPGDSPGNVVARVNGVSSPNIAIFPNH